MVRGVRLRPAHPVAKAGPPLVRMVQRRFAADSLQSMATAVSAGCTGPLGDQFIPRQLPSLGRRKESEREQRACEEPFRGRPQRQGTFLLAESSLPLEGALRFL